MRLLANVLTTFVLIAVIALATLVLATRIPATHLELKIVKSGSMEPTIPTGSVVLIAPANEYLVGDIITFGEDSKDAVPTTHRITASRSEDSTTYFTTKGDANEDPDPVETAAAKVIGHVLVSIPYVGYVLAFAKTPPGFTLLILIPAGLIILSELMGIVREVRRPREERERETEQEFAPAPRALSRRPDPVPIRPAAPRSMGRF